MKTRSLMHIQPAIRRARIIPLNAPKPSHHSRSKALIIKSHDGYEIIPLDEIIRCAAEGNYSKIYKSDGQHTLVSKTLKEIEKELPDHLFVRVHQSHIIALCEIRRIGSENKIELTGRSRIPLSRRRKADVLRRLGV